MAAYYNELDPFAAQWLRNLIKAGHIPDGEVDERSIVDVEPADLRQFRQCHFFAGIGGWAYAARLAGWPDDRELWTGSLPCQPYSVAGLGLGNADPRDLWEHQRRLIEARKPAVWMGEQVAAAIGKGWLDRLCDDLEAIGYACGAAVIQACAVGRQHERSRLYAVADAVSCGRGKSGLYAPSGKAKASEWPANKPGNGYEASSRRGWDGKYRRTEPSIQLLVDGVPGRVGRLRAYGNAIVPQVAAQVIGAYLDVHP